MHLENVGDALKPSRTPFQEFWEWLVIKMPSDALRAPWWLKRREDTQSTGGF